MGLLTADENRPIEYAFDMLGQYNIRRIILVDKDKNFSGVVLQEDLFDYLEEDVYKVDLKIENIINKSLKLQTVCIDDSIKKVIELMQKFKIGSLVVLHNNKCVGIVTEKDILKVQFNEVNLEEKVSLHMSSPVISLKESIFVTDAIEVMKVKHIRRIVITNEDDVPISILTNRDILKHVKGNYTRTLQNKIKHAQEIMNFLPEPIIEVYYTHNEDMIHWVNTQAQNVFGENIIDSKITDIIKKEDWDYIKDFLKDQKILKDLNIQVKEKVFELSGSLMNSSGNNYIKLLFKDVTDYELEKVKLQQIIEDEIAKRIDSEYLMMQQSKLATMGEMIGHIAHQWRQPLNQLGGIFLNLETASSFGELDQKYLQQKLNSCNEIITHMSNTIEDFRYFFRPTKEKELFDICKYINNAINLIKASLTYSKIKVKFQESDNKFFIQGYPSEFAQVVLNILSNANDVLVLNKIKDPYIEIVIRENNKKVFIDIKDNGGGIDNEIIDEIFNIYFSTKTKEEGTGIGLYMSRLIIETKFGGKLYATNSKDGAVFTIEFTKTK
ncbi:MAG: CBS domain-containing protein [Arcobacteraceae bacterium]|nr:CBS domain-containing protein [Arcobacteraceae bacterium]